MAQREGRVHDREAADRRRFEAMFDERLAGVLDYAVACADLETIVAAAAAVFLGAALAAQDERGLMDRRHVRALTRSSIGRELPRTGFKVVRRHFTADVPTRASGKAARLAGVLGRLAVAIHPSPFAYRFPYDRETEPTPTLIDESLVAS